MKRKWLLLACVVIATGANAADDESLRQQVESLSKRVTQLEQRLDALESPEVKQVIEQVVPPSNPGDSSDVSNWSRLKVGYTYDDVRKLLGEPVRIKKGGMEFWYYSDKGLDGPFVKFLFRQVNAWQAPQ
jgi:hypothetical protein